MNDLRSMAAKLGGVVVKGEKGPFVLCPGPGHSAKDRSLSVTPSTKASDGFVVHSFAGKDWRTCRDHVRQRLGLPAEPRQSAGADNSSRAVELWNASVDPRRTLAERYLRGRGLELPPDVASRVVRFHAACPRRKEDNTFERRPAMLTAFRTIVGDRLIAVHRTFLTADGKKIDRQMLGPVKGAAIKIDADENVEQGLMIGEGFETCLAARMLGFRPAWALGSAGAIADFPVLSGIDVLTILAETDDSGANAKAMRACGNRWAAADREVIVATPYIRGDMNDAVQA